MSTATSLQPTGCWIVLKQQDARNLTTYYMTVQIGFIPN